MARLFRFVVLPSLLLIEVGALIVFKFWLHAMPDMFVHGLVAGMFLVLACFAIVGDRR